MAPRANRAQIHIPCSNWTKVNIIRVTNGRACSIAQPVVTMPKKTEQPHGNAHHRLLVVTINARGGLLGHDQGFSFPL